MAAGMCPTAIGSFGRRNRRRTPFRPRWFGIGRPPILPAERSCPFRRFSGTFRMGHPAVEEQAADPGLEGEDREADGLPDALGAGRTEDESEPADEATPTEQDRSITTVPARRIPDFMDESTGASAWESPSRAYLRRPAPAGHDRVGISRKKIAAPAHSGA